MEGDLARLIGPVKPAEHFPLPTEASADFASQTGLLLAKDRREIAFIVDM